MRVPVTCTTLLLLAGVASAADPKPIEELRILKVGVSTSEEEFLKLHSTAKRVKTPDDKHLARTYEVPSGQGCTATFQYLGGKMVHMNMMWLKSGGADTSEWKELTEHMIAKYGEPDTRLSTRKKNEPLSGIYSWTNNKTKNFMSMDINDDMLMIGLLDHERSEQLKAFRKQK
jgi:hypothetical protein